MLPPWCEIWDQRAQLEQYTFRTKELTKSKKVASKKNQIISDVGAYHAMWFLNRVLIFILLKLVKICQCKICNFQVFQFFLAQSYNSLRIQVLNGIDFFLLHSEICHCHFSSYFRLTFFAKITCMRHAMIHDLFFSSLFLERVVFFRWY